MRSGLTLSVGVHAIAILFGWVDLPYLQSDPPPLDDIVFVKMADVAEVTNIPPAAPEPETKLQEKARAAPPPSKVPPRPKPPAKQPETAAVPAKPPPPPEPAPEPVPEPPPEPVSEPEPEPVPVPAPKPKPVAPPKKQPPPPPPVTQPATPTPPKPKQPDRQFAHLLQDLKKKPSAALAREDTVKDVLKRARKDTLRQPSPAADPDHGVTISEIDVVRQQIAECWNVMAGARKAETLNVEIEITMSTEAIILQTRVVDQARMQTDPHFRAAARSALRALGDPRCRKLRLPAEKYQHWKTFTFNFDPQYMLQ